MSKAPLISLFATALLVGWYAPTLSADLGEPEGRGEVLEVRPDKARFAAARPDAWGAGGTVLTRSDDGHFYAEVSVEAADYRFLVDTGASVVALTGEDAADMGLQWSEMDLRAIARGANGTVFGVPVMIERMEVDGIAVRNVQAAIIPEGLHVSLLGQSFLSRFDEVSIKGDRMMLGS